MVLCGLAEMLFHLVCNLSPFDHMLEETKSYCLLTDYVSLGRHLGLKKLEGPGVTDLSFLGCHTKTKETARPDFHLSSPLTTHQ